MANPGWRRALRPTSRSLKLTDGQCLEAALYWDALNAEKHISIAVGSRCSLNSSEGRRFGSQGLCRRLGPTRMIFRLIIIRLVALVVLFTAASDYWAYDRWDPDAPMNASGPEAVAVFTAVGASNTSLLSANLPDDHCLCCSPLVVPPAPVLPQIGFGSCVAVIHHSIGQPSPRPTDAGASISSPPLTGFDRPLRI